MTIEYFTVDQFDHVEFHGTEDAARKDAESALDDARDDAPEGWHENTEGIRWGRCVVMGQVVETSREPAPEGVGYDETVDYALIDQPELADTAAERDTLRAKLAKFIAGNPHVDNDSPEAVVELLEREADDLSLEDARAYYVANTANWTWALQETVALRAEAARHRAEVERLRAEHGLADAVISNETAEVLRLRAEVERLKRAHQEAGVALEAAAQCLPSRSAVRELGENWSDEIEKELADALYGVAGNIGEAASVLRAALAESGK